MTHIRILHAPNKHTSLGFTLIELLVALVIGLLSLYAVYQVFSGNERTNRTITSVNEAQTSGIFSILLLEQLIQSAGVWHANSGPNAQLLANNCATGVDLGGVASPATLSLRPLPLVIRASATDPNNYDDIFVFSGGAARHVDPIAVSAVDDAAETITVASPFGFRAGDTVIGVNTAGCAIYRIVNDSTLNITSTQATSRYQGINAPTTATQLIDLGNPVRYHFFVDNNSVLQMAEWTPDASGNGQWTLSNTETIANNVVFFRAQYGIDTVNDRRVDTWADASAIPWNYASLLTANINAIQQIKTVRIAIVVRADEPEKAETFNQPTNFTVFPCPVGMTCSPAVPLDYLPGTGPGGTTFRYRLYETEIPLRNTIWA